MKQFHYTLKNTPIDVNSTRWIKYIGISLLTFGLFAILIDLFPSTPELEQINQLLGMIFGAGIFISSILFLKKKRNSDIFLSVFLVLNLILYTTNTYFIVGKEIDGLLWYIIEVIVYFTKNIFEAGFLGFMLRQNRKMYR